MIMEVSRTIVGAVDIMMRMIYQLMSYRIMYYVEAYVKKFFIIVL